MHGMSAGREGTIPMAIVRGTDSRLRWKKVPAAVQGHRFHAQRE
jgi:hypothetical protein